MRYRFLEYLEKQAQRGQGKGFGAKSIRHEVRAALPFLPASNAVVFDVGANKGLWTKEMLRVASPKIGTLYCSSRRSTISPCWKRSAIRAWC